MGMIRFILEGEGANIGHVFTPGSTVRGKALYILEKEKKVENILLGLSGYIRNYVRERSGNNTHTYREEIVLFNDVRSVFSGSYKMQAQTLEFPFEFTFPTHSTFDRGDGRSMWHSELRSAFTPPGTIPLPPSFAGSTSRFRSGDASILYALTLTVNPDSIFRSDQQSLQLPFSPVAELHSSPHIALFAMQDSEWESRSLRAQQHTFKQKLAHAFGSDPSLKTPGIRFKLKFGLPDVIGQEIVAPLAVSMEYKRLHQTDIEAPTLTLLSVRVALMGFSVMRVGTTFRDYTRESRVEEAWWEAAGINMLLPLDGSTIYPRQDFGLNSFQLTRAFAPTFAAWTVAHAHTFSISAKVRHEESGHVIDVENTDQTVTVLFPNTAPASLPAYIAPDQPPPYDPGEGSSNSVAQPWKKDSGMASKVE